MFLRYYVQFGLKTLLAYVKDSVYLRTVHHCQQWNVYNIFIKQAKLCPSQQNPVFLSFMTMFLLMIILVSFYYVYCFGCYVLYFSPPKHSQNRFAAILIVS